MAVMKVYVYSSAMGTRPLNGVFASVICTDHAMSTDTTGNYTGIGDGLLVTVVYFSFGSKKWTASTVLSTVRRTTGMCLTSNAMVVGLYWHTLKTK